MFYIKQSTAMQETAGCHLIIKSFLILFISKRKQ